MMKQYACQFRNLPLQKRMDMIELQTHHCMGPDYWTWLLCSVTVIPANKLPMQELNQSFGIKLLTSDFLNIFGS